MHGRCHIYWAFVLTLTGLPSPVAGGQPSSNIFGHPVRRVTSSDSALLGPAGPGRGRGHSWNAEAPGDDPRTRLSSSEGRLEGTGRVTPGHSEPRSRHRHSPRPRAHTLWSASGSVSQLRRANCF